MWPEGEAKDTTDALSKYKRYYETFILECKAHPWYTITVISGYTLDIAVHFLFVWNELDIVTKLSTYSSPSPADGTGKAHSGYFSIVDVHPPYIHNTTRL